MNAAVTVAAAPEGEALSEHYTLQVAGQAVPVYECRVSAMPFNQVWPGYQRPLDQTETAGFACWSMTDAARVEIVSQRPIENVVVRPLSLGIKPAVEGDRITFELPAPRYVVVEVNGPHHALHLFADPPEENVPAPHAADVVYFGPGVHHPGRIDLQSNQTVYLAPGAVVYAGIQGNSVTNARILGRGIIDVSEFERGKGGGAIRLADCSNITIDGVVMRDPDVWCCALFGCHDATIRRVKLVGLWRYNADGIDVCNSQNVTVEDSFVRAFDDALVVKGLKSAYDARPCTNLAFRRNVVWCDWGRAMEFGAETCTPEMANVVFEDSDIIRTTHIAMDIQHGDRAHIHDIRFEDIRVEMEPPNPRPKMQQGEDAKYDPGEDNFLPALFVIVIRGTYYSKDTERGTVRNVLFKDIQVTAPWMPSSSLTGADAEHDVQGVRFENVTLNGRRLGSLGEARIGVGKDVGEVELE